MFKPSAIGVMVSLKVEGDGVGISILQYNSFQLQKKQIMQTPQYKTTWHKYEVVNLTINNSHANFQRQKMVEVCANSVDSNFHIPFADLQALSRPRRRA